MHMLNQDSGKVGSGRGGSIYVILYKTVRDCTIMYTYSIQVALVLGRAQDNYIQCLRESVNLFLQSSVGV